MQRYFVKCREDNYLILDNDDVHHIRDVMRNKVGEMVECVFDEQLYLCEIIDVNSSKVLIKEALDSYNELDFNVTIGIGLVKEQKMDLVLQKLTELGVSKVIPLKMERSIVKLDDKKVASKLERWKKICKEASEQSKRNIIPEITNPMTIKELKDYYCDYKYVCSLNSNTILDYDMIGTIEKNKEILFIIGPEGGISPKEEEQLINMGYKPVSLNNRVMRVETASIYVASVMNFCSKR